MRHQLLVTNDERRRRGSNSGSHRGRPALRLRSQDVRDRGDASRADPGSRTCRCAEDRRYALSLAEHLFLFVGENAMSTCTEMSYSRYHDNNLVYSKPMDHLADDFKAIHASFRPR